MPQTETNGTFTENTLINYTLSAYKEDGNTAGSIFVVAPHKGKIVGLNATNYVANTTTKTVLTAELGGTLITTPAWEIAVTQAVGVASTSVPTAANSVDAGDVIEIITDGGGTPTMPINVTISIDRD